MTTPREDPAPAPLAIVLAAGRGRRFGQGPKAWVRLGTGEETLLERAVRVLGAGGIDRVIAVVPEPPWPLEPAGVVLIPNPEVDRGPLGSAQLGLAAAPDATTALLHPVDHPDVTPDVIVALRHATVAAPDDVARVVPVFEGRRGHPVLLTPRGVAAVRAASGDGTLREALTAGGSCLDVPVGCAGVLRNLNRPGD